MNCIPINNISVINQLYIYFKLFLITVYHSGWTISFRLIDSYPIANISILGLIFFLNVKYLGSFFLWLLFFQWWHRCTRPCKSFWLQRRQPQVNFFDYYSMSLALLSSDPPDQIRLYSSKYVEIMLRFPQLTHWHAEQAIAKKVPKQNHSCAFRLI